MGIGSGGQPAEERREHVGRTIADDAALQFARGGLPAKAAYGRSGEIADGLDGVDGEQQAQRDAGGRFERHAEMQELRQREPCRPRHVGKLDHAEQERHEIAARHAEQDGSELADPLAEVVERHDRRQRQPCDQPVLPGAVDQRLRHAAELDDLRIGVACAAGHVVDRRRIERKADGKDHRAGDDRRKQHPDLFDEQPDEDGHEPAHHHGAGDGGDSAAGRGDRLHAGHIGEADAHDDRQSGAEAAGDGIELQQRGNGGHDQRRLDQEHLVAGGEPNGVGDDDGGRHAAHDHGDQMLQREGYGGAGGRSAVEPEQGLLAGCGFARRFFVHDAERPPAYWNTCGGILGSIDGDCRYILIIPQFRAKASAGFAVAAFLRGGAWGRCGRGRRRLRRGAAGRFCAVPDLRAVDKRRVIP